MNEIITSCSETFDIKRVKWVYKIISGIWGIKFTFLTYRELRRQGAVNSAHKPILIFYGDDDLGDIKNVFYLIRILPSPHASFLYKCQQSMSDKNHFAMPSVRNFGALPYPFFSNCADEAKPERLNGKHDEFFLFQDIIASIFFLASRIEETCLELDEHHRACYASSWMGKNGFIEMPLVNMWAESLWEYVLTYNPEIKSLRKNPEDNFSILLTHDVDIHKKWTLKRFASDILKEKKISLAGKNLLSGKKDPFDTFHQMMSWEKQCGFKSVFLFISGGEHPYDKAYRLSTRTILQTMNEISSNGFSIGMHGSYSSGDDPALISSEKKNLESYLLGEKAMFIRQHYLRLKIPETWIGQSEAGFKFDSTLAFADKTGFRAGLCTPFHPFDFNVSNMALPIIEIPLTIMDATLKFYEKLSPDEAFEKIIRLALSIRKYGGVFTLLWHNTSLDPDTWLGWEDMYYKILKKLAEMNPKDFIDNIKS